MDDRLLNDLASDRPDGALERAFARLSQGGDLRLVLAMVRALVRAGIPGVALRLLEALGPQAGPAAELAALGEQIRRLPPGAIESSAALRQFEANLGQLLTGRPQLEPLASGLRAAAQALTIFRTRHGNTCALRTADRGGFVPVLPLIDSDACAGRLSLPPVEVGLAFLLVGVPCQALLRRLLALRTESGFTPPIDIIEPDREALAAWLMTDDWADVLRTGRVGLAAGSDAAAQYRRFLLDHPMRALPMCTIINARANLTASPLEKTFFPDLQRELASLRRAQYEAQARAYSERDADHWAGRFVDPVGVPREKNGGNDRIEEPWRNGGGASRAAVLTPRSASRSVRGGRGVGRPLHIVGFTTRYSTVIQHAMRDLAAAFRRRGCRFDAVAEPDDWSYQVDLWSSLEGGEADLIVVINHLRFELEGHLCDRVPFIGWIQDYMHRLWSPEAGASIGEMDLVLGHSPDTMTRRFGYPADRFLATSNLTDPHTYSAAALPEAQLAPWRCDLAYVGHGWAAPEALAREIAGPGQPEFAACLERIAAAGRDRLDQRGWITYLDRLAIIREACEAGPGLPAAALSQGASGSTPSARIVMYEAAVRVLDRVIRHQTLEWAARWAAERGRIFRLYGRGWDRHPTLSAYACGEVPNGQPLRAAYQAAAAHLHVNGYHSLHQRLLDGLAAGACVLTRYNPADFLREPYQVIRGRIDDGSLETLDDLLRAARVDRSLEEAIRRVEALSDTRLASASDPVRRRQIDLLRTAPLFDDAMLTDAGLMSILRSGGGVPHRTAADIDGFEAATFRTEAGLHETLDRLVADADGRRSLAAPMRASVLAHDTFDILVDRVLVRWRELLGGPLETAT